MSTTDIPIPVARLVRELSVDERTEYERDGAAVVRGVIPLEWVEALSAAVDRLMVASGMPAVDFAAGDGPRFFSLLYSSMFDPVIKAWGGQGPLVELARQVLPETTRLNFYLDQIFAREKGATKVTPFHQDLPYMPLSGTQIIRFWVPLDSVDVDNGAVQYLKGSHRGPVYRARSFDQTNPVASTYDGAEEFEPLPDFAAQYDRHDWLIGVCEPGDVLLHHPRTVHGSPPNVAIRRRRGLATMYTGDDVRYAPRATSAAANTALTGHVPRPDLAPGDPIDCELFPRVWTA
ncbi:phytanoyl-CoA dioxygenase family protein [Sporichthya sp.]|uniref:phytanoyl-CoA dioxygenase family protein n=1 Tax=Sporichthya sp. TaxID=65475 RepID=UPI0017EE895F|nr:phytanoyl-CoA dioxygenase family protein [Sporichthya sp.]MBA3742631.1 phytanoyl-CoA dioxygenase family protein [Sporichthya sp.]